MLALKVIVDENGDSILPAFDDDFFDEISAARKKRWKNERLTRGQCPLCSEKSECTSGSFWHHIMCYHLRPQHKNLPSDIYDLNPEFTDHMTIPPDGNWVIDFSREHHLSPELKSMRIRYDTLFFLEGNLPSTRLPLCHTNLFMIGFIKTNYTSFCYRCPLCPNFYYSNSCLLPVVLAACAHLCIAHCDQKELVQLVEQEVSDLNEAHGTSFQLAPELPKEGVQLSNTLKASELAYIMPYYDCFFKEAVMCRFCFRVCLNDLHFRRHSRPCNDMIKKYVDAALPLCPEGSQPKSESTELVFEDTEVPSLLVLQTVASQKSNRASNLVKRPTANLRKRPASPKFELPGEKPLPKRRSLPRKAKKPLAVEPVTSTRILRTSLQRKTPFRESSSSSSDSDVVCLQEVVKTTKNLRSAPRRRKPFPDVSSSSSDSDQGSSVVAKPTIPKVLVRSSQRKKPFPDVSSSESDDDPIEVFGPQKKHSAALSSTSAVCSARSKFYFSSSLSPTPHCRTAGRRPRCKTQRPGGF